MAISQRFILFIFFLILCNPSPSSSISLRKLKFPISNHQIILSLSGSLLRRVADRREQRGDAVGAARVRSIAGIVGGGFGWEWGRFARAVVLDYAENSALRDAVLFEIVGAVSDINELIGALAELTRVRSEAERVEWVDRNHENAVRIAKSLSCRLFMIIRESGPLREVLETVQKEIVEGDLLKDCLELGGNDLKGLILILKDIALQYASTSSTLSDL